MAECDDKLSLAAYLKALMRSLVPRHEEKKRSVQCCWMSWYWRLCPVINKYTMAKGKYTRKEAGIKAYMEVTGEELPSRVTVAEIREYSKALPEDQRKRCHELYLHYMSIGRSEYLEHYSNH